MGSVFIVRCVQAHGRQGVAGEPGAQKDIRVGGGSGYTPGAQPDSPAAVPGLMGFVERARAKEEEKSIV